MSGSGWSGYHQYTAAETQSCFSNNHGRNNTVQEKSQIASGKLKKERGITLIHVMVVQEVLSKEFR